MMGLLIKEKFNVNKIRIFWNGTLNMQTNAWLQYVYSYNLRLEHNTVVNTILSPSLDVASVIKNEESYFSR